MGSAEITRLLVEDLLGSSTSFLSQGLSRISQTSIASLEAILDHVAGASTVEASNTG